MSVPDYWTAADAAELDVLLRALAYGSAEHRRQCQRCTRRGESGSLPCPHLQAAIAEVVEWRDARLLLSRAEALRREIQERAA
jgi:hypothetical protein